MFWKVSDTVITSSGRKMLLLNVCSIFQTKFLSIGYMYIIVQELSFICISCTLHAISILNPALSESSFVYIICESSETAQICV